MLRCIKPQSIPAPTLMRLGRSGRAVRPGPPSGALSTAEFEPLEPSRRSGTERPTAWAVTMRLGLVLLALALMATRGVAGLTWPASQFLPTFATPAATIDCIEMDSWSAAQQALFVSLQGLVNRTQPRLACVSAASEGKFTWLSLHGLSYASIDGFVAIQKYKTNVTGLVVTDPTQPDTLNLATTIAGLKNELICDPGLLLALTNAPYNFPIIDDLRGKFANKYQVYGYLYTNYWPQCTHRLIAGLQPGNYWQLRDYLVATKSAVVWLDPNVSADATALAPFVSAMTPVNGVYLGWWPDEGAGLQWIAQYGLPVIASDYFDNGSVFGGVATPLLIPPIPPTPPLQNKVYVSLTLSDGDNVQYMQHFMKMSWASSARGQVPIGWTVQPLAVDLDPGMLNYYWITATANDCLVAGPSGAGYNRINYWSPANVVSYTKASNPYLQSSGIRIITVWMTVSSATANAFATNCPTLVGINDQTGNYSTTSYQGLPLIRFPAKGSYASTIADLLSAITNTAASWNGSAPMFIPVQGSAWNISPANCLTIAKALDPAKYVVVRPDHLFLLYQQAAGLGKGGAAPYLATQPASQVAGLGSNITFSARACGTGPLSYQWRLNGTNLPGAVSTSYTRFNVPASAVGNYQVVVTNLYGAVTSRVAVLTFGNQPLGFNGNGLTWTVNQNSSFYPYSTPAMADNLLTLTDGGGGETRSFFFNRPQYIGAFKAAFTYQAGGNKAADGVTFCLHNDSRGPSALGGGGGQLGFGPAGPITPSLALELNLFTGNGQAVGYTVLTNGLTGASGGNGNYRAPGAVQINSGHPITITLTYAKPQLTLTFADAVAHTTFTTTLNVGDLAQRLGADTAYIGFTGSDGGSTAVQTLSDFSFVSVPSAAIQGSGTNALISWSGGAPGFTLQQNSNLTQANWVSVTNPMTSTLGLNQVTVPANASNVFYRLVLPAP